MRQRVSLAIALGGLLVSLGCQHVRGQKYVGPQSGQTTSPSATYATDSRNYGHSPSESFVSPTGNLVTGEFGGDHVPPQPLAEIPAAPAAAE